MIFVQVNPGETFTIRTEDGHFQCITGPAQVPMVSPNGTMPPIFVPPGYISQVVEENGMRKVLILPHSMEFHPSLSPFPQYAPLYSPPHPSVLHHPHIYPAELSPRYIHQLPAVPIYTDQGESPAIGKEVSVTVLYLVKGVSSETVTFTTLYGVPDIPATPRLIHRTKSSISLQWRSPNDNGSKVTGFCLEYHEVRGQAFKEVYSGLAKQYKVMRLMPSTKYAFRLAAKNNVGMSAVLNCCTASCTASPPAPPSAARLKEAGAMWLSLEWSAPCGPASQDTLSYIVEMEEIGSSCGFQLKHRGEELSCTVRELRRFTAYRFRTRIKMPVLTLKCSIVDVPVCVHACAGDKWDIVYRGPLRQYVCEGLQEGTWYRLRVYCQSQGGKSQVRPEGKCTVYLWNPASYDVTGVLILSSGKVYLRFVFHRYQRAYPPVWDGGAAVSQYCVEIAHSAEGSQEQVFQGTDAHCTVGQLLPGRTYLFWVKASNSAGWGPASEMCQACTTPGVPEQCNAPQPEVCMFRMAWGVEESALELLYSGPFSQHEVRDLQPATYYYCKVQAVNVIGAGLFSRVAIVTTPASVPAAVEHIEEVEEEPLGGVMAATSLALQWKEPQCHGADITGYNIDIGEELPLCVGRTNYHILENLQPDTTYRIRVQAVNDVGAGPFSSTLRLQTAPAPPEPPLLECVVAGPQSLKLKWGESPGGSQSSRSTHYCLQVQDVKGNASIGPCRTFKVQRLCEATAYCFSIQAHSESGPGPLSPPYTFSTTRSPPLQLRAPKLESVEGNKHMVTWEALQPMRGDPIVYALQLLRGREMEQLYKGPATSYAWVGQAGGGACHLRVCAIRQAQDGTELWGPWSLVVPVPITEVPNEAPPPGGCPRPHTERGWPLADESFATALLLCFVVLAVFFAVLLQYLVIERQ
uniref:Fibronectin type-III domain-containing protein n=1 Tax=Electrophorus electricus TaxID=8005 RepID=A0A4W4HGZ9_ELEEL